MLNYLLWRQKKVTALHTLQEVSLDRMVVKSWKYRYKIWIDVVSSRT